MSEQILLIRHDAVAEIVINRPEKMNALTPEMTGTLGRICTDVDRDEAIRVVLLRGTGDRAFCAGSDLGSLLTYQTVLSFRNRLEYATLFRDIRKPLVVALKGWVLGGGFEIMLTADLRVAGKGAKFGTPEVTRGWVGGGGASQMLPRQIGYGQAMRLLLAAETIDAEEAYRLGIIEYLVEDVEVDAKAMAICQKLAEFSPAATQSVKAAVRAAMSMPLSAGLKYENELTSLCFASGNYREGATAFTQRRDTTKSE